MIHTVTFDVGGKQYRVSETLLHEYPNTMLGKMASLRNNNNDDHDISEQQPIFIDRDSERFRYVLDYMRDGKVSLPSTIPREALCLDLKYLGFENYDNLQSIIKCHHSELTTTRMNQPMVDGLECHKVVWDVTRASNGLVIENEHVTVKKSSTDDLWQSVLGTVGFSSGIHYWNIEILESSNHNRIRIGVSSNLNVTCNSFPGHGDDTGVSYGYDGNRHYSNINGSFGPSYTTGDIIGTLLNMNDKTVTFYKNSIRVGTAVGKDILLDDIYYPCVTLFAIGQQVSSCDIPQDEEEAQTTHE